MEIGLLDQTIEGGLSFRGVNILEMILKRCVKGGVVSGEELLNIADTLYRYLFLYFWISLLYHKVIIILNLEYSDYVFM